MSENETEKVESAPPVEEQKETVINETQSDQPAAVVPGAASEPAIEQPQAAAAESAPPTEIAREETAPTGAEV